MSQLSENEIATLKEKYGKIKILTVTVDEEENETYEFAVRRPDRSLMSMATRYASENNIDKFNEILVKNLIVGGDIAALEDGIVYMGVIGELATTIEPAAAFLKKA
jgi:hypothetical protein